jgi:hypothetical protein
MRITIKIINQAPPAAVADQTRAGNPVDGGRLVQPPGDSPDEGGIKDAPMPETSEQPLRGEVTIDEWFAQQNAAADQAFKTLMRSKRRLKPLTPEELKQMKARKQAIETMWHNGVAIEVPADSARKLPAVSLRKLREMASHKRDLDRLREDLAERQREIEGLLKELEQELSPLLLGLAEGRSLL